MKPRAFFDLVCELRQAQKDYFAARKQGLPREDCNYYLGKSKSLEQRVDAEIERVQQILAQQNQ